MNNDILGQIREKLEEAELVLIGIGEQLAVPTRMMEDNDKFNKILSDDSKTEYYPYLQQIFVEENSKEYIEFYNRLNKLIENKNYYVLTTNADDVVFKSDINHDRIVAPCGSIHQFVCSECKGDIEFFDSFAKEHNQEILKKGDVEKFQVKKCPSCGKIMQPNIVSYGYYDEKGYLDKWTRYTKWLQGTVNRKLCILELGVGLNYPTVIRWPNEKIVTYNNKSFMFRIHDKWYQLSEGIGERAKSVAENPMNII